MPADPPMGGDGPGPDETGIWDINDEASEPGPDETSMWDVPDLQSPAVEPEPSVIVDWESEPTLTDAPAFPEVESDATETAETGAITSETAEGGRQLVRL